MRYIENTIRTTPVAEKWITDTDTGLDWAVYNQRELSWEEAKEYAECLGDGWRLPTIQELIAIIDYETSIPATKMQEIAPDYYWSATTCAPNTSYAWVVDFSYGSVSIDDRTNSRQVVCVRDPNNPITNNDK